MSRSPVNAPSSLSPVIVRVKTPAGTMTKSRGSVLWLAAKIASRSEQFARALAVRLTSYALGRSLEITDEDDIDELAAEFAANDYRLRDLIHRLISSELFDTK